MKRNLLILISAALVAGAIAQSGRVELLATMRGAGKAKATWKTRDTGNQLQAELQVEGERLTRNSAVTVQIGTQTWATTTNAFGQFRIALRYNTTNRPTIRVGTPASVKNAAGVVILAGTFANK